jgi:hypothetical protein
MISEQLFGDYSDDMLQWWGVHKSLSSHKLVS